MEPTERVERRPDEGIGSEPTPEDFGEKSNLPFSIAGEVSKRGILWKELPVYPRDLQKEVTLKFRFWVLPDGSVQNIIPLEKGDPRLEKITTDALFKWKFSPLPPPSQETQEGVITFIYRLQ